jgi:multidrug efflux pump subunit AcrA (membrane-fusion protein)
VTYVAVKVGDKVRKDQVLATLESTEVDSSLQTARMNLESAQVTYDKLVSNTNKELDLLEANSTLQTAQSNLDTIEQTITLKNHEEDVKIEQAQIEYDDAVEEYKELYTESLSAWSDTARNRKNTYTEAVDTLRDMYNSAQTNSDTIDKVMLYTDKFGIEGTASIYLGARDVDAQNTTEHNFFLVQQAILELKDHYTTLSILDTDDTTVHQLETAYQKMTTLSKLLMNLGTSSRSLFENSITSADVLTQNMLDNYITQANTIYSNGRSMKDKATTIMESIYKLDDESNIDSAKKIMDNAKITLDKLLLSKANRVASNQADRVAAQASIISAKQNISNIEQ